MELLHGVHLLILLETLSRVATPSPACEPDRDRSTVDLVGISSEGARYLMVVGVMSAACLVRRLASWAVGDGAATRQIEPALSINKAS